MSFFSHRQDLFLFKYGNEEIALTTSNKELTFQNRTYKPLRYLSRSKVNNQGTNDKAPEMTITMSKDSEVAAWFKYSSPWRKVELFIYQVSTADLNDYITLWSGTVISSKFKKNEVFLDCFSSEQMLDKIVGRMTCQYKCNHNLYFDGCGLDINDHSITATITSIAEDGINIELDTNGGFDDQWFKNGTVQKNADLQVRGITNHVGNTITMLYVIEGLKVGDVVRVSWGCDRLPTTCKNKFNNFTNYRGEPFTPKVSPFAGDIQ